MKPIPDNAYFHCVPWNAPTMKVDMCRKYRDMPVKMKANAYGQLGGKVRPLVCRECALAVEMEAGRVETWTLAQAEAATEERKSAT